MHVLHSQINFPNDTKLYCEIRPSQTQSTFKTGEKKEEFGKILSNRNIQHFHLH